MYIPKNRIKENLYTPGDEYMIKSNRENYTGFYHSLYTGRFYTGKTPNDSDIRELIKIEVTGNDLLPPELSSTNKIALFLNDPDPVISTDQWIQKDIVTYMVLSGKDPRDDEPRAYPQSFYPKPTEDDYQLGSFTRYFIVKINELIYTEIDLKTYKEITKQSNNILWELFTPFKIQWTLEGIEDNVFDTNRNQVLLLEQRLNRKGLTDFLRNDFLQFYRSKNLNNQYTSGDDYALPNGLSYQGLYHVMPNGQAMTGRFHGEAEDIPLTPLSS
tara:strand:+ start:4914 stop:5729 length:816 start_codon:yes stop_codon:yes gene_type:complete